MFDWTHFQRKLMISGDSYKLTNEMKFGTTGNSISSRFGQHRGYVNQYKTKIEAGKIPEATGEHFNLPIHSISDMSLQIVEKVFSKSKAVREQREKMYINYFESETKGINRRQ